MVLPTRASGEIGTLARAFAGATSEISDKTMALEREADERRRVIDMLNNTITSTMDPDHRRPDRTDRSS